MRDDNHLINKCRKGDRRSQLEFYNKYKNFVMGICVRYCSNNEDAEDVLQETFVKVFQNLHLHKSLQSTKGWIRKIAVNQSINHWHKFNKFKPENDLDSVSEKVSSDINNIIDDLQTEVLLELVRSLPDEYRIIFNLHAIEGYSHREISNILNIPINTSKSHLRRGILILKKRLSKIGYKHWFYEKII